MIRRTAAALAALALTLGLLGAGIGATWSDQATANQSATYVGTFACQLSTTTPGAVVTENGHTVTFTEAQIQQSAPTQGGNAENLNVTVHNSGSIPMKLHWTITGPQYNTPPYNQAPWNTYHSGVPGPTQTGSFGTSSGSPSMAQDVVPFAGGASLTYSYLGFMWLTPLTNADLGATLTATYHVDCTEFDQSLVLRPTYVGGASVAGAGPLSLPSGWQAGDVAIAYTVRSGTSASPAPGGFTSMYASVTQRTNLSYRVLQSGDTTFTATNATGFELLVYHHAAVANIGGNPQYVISGAYGASGTTAACYMPSNTPYVMPTDGSAVVVCVGADSNATFNMKSLAVTGPPALGNRSAGFAAGNMGAADTADAPVNAWPNGGTSIGSFALTGTSRAKNTLSTALVYAP